MLLDTVPLKNLAEITMGQSPDSAHVNDREMGLPFLQGCAEFGRQHPVPETYCNPPLRVAQCDSILVSVRAPVGTINWGDQKYCIGRGLAAIKGRQNIADTKFLSFVLQNDSRYLDRRSQGSTFLAIGSQDLANYPVPVISFGLQKKIANILQTIDEAIERTEQLIEKYQQIKVGLMHDLFTRGIGADGKLRPPREQAPELYHKTPIGWIPKEWMTKRLKDIAAVGTPVLRTGPFGSSLKGEHWVDYGVYVITIGALGDNKFIDEELLNISESYANVLNDFRMKEGEVVFSRVADVGRSVVIGEDQVGWVMSSNLMRIHIDNKIMLPEILQLQLSSFNQIKKQIRCKVNSGGREVANSEILNSLLFICPDSNEQERIIKSSSLIGKKIEDEFRFLHKLRLKKSGLMHDLLTGEVPVTADWPVEPLSPEEGAA